MSTVVQVRSGRFRAVADVPAFLFGAATVALLGFASGGFFPTVLGWTALATLTVAMIVGTVCGWPARSLPMTLFLAAAIGFGAWTALSLAWSESRSSTAHEVQRCLAYVGIATAAYAFSSSRRAVQDGVLLGIVIVCLYALTTRLLPDVAGGFDSTSFGYRLAAPISYWNGLGAFAAIGAVLALGRTVDGAGGIIGRLGAAASLPALTETIYFTFSRGAWLAMFLGLVVLLTLERRRLELLVTIVAIAAACALAIGEAHRSALVSSGSSLATAVTQGRGAAAWLVLASCVAASATLFVSRLPRTWGRKVRPYAFAALLSVIVAAALTFALVRYGTPNSPLHDAWAQIHSPPPPLQGDTQRRLFNLSLNGRIELWKTAIRMFNGAPFLGTGAGTFWIHWAASGSPTGATLFTHSLYLQTLGETGVVGIVVLLVLLFSPFAAIRNPRAAASLSAFSVFLVHAAVDWDWQLGAVAGTAIILAVVAIASLSPASRPTRLGALYFFAGMALVATLPQLLSDQLVKTATAEITSRPSEAVDKAALAARITPWVSDPLEIAGDAEVARGDERRASRFYGRAIGRDPNNWNLWARLTSVLPPSRRRRDAAETARRLNPLVRVSPVRKRPSGR